MSESTTNTNRKPVNPKRAENIAKAQAHWSKGQDRKEANRIKREEAAAIRSPQEQIKRLDSRLGIGVGAEKERARLAAKIAAEKSEKASQTSEAPSKRRKLTEAQRAAKEAQRAANLAAHAAQ